MDDGFASRARTILDETVAAAPGIPGVVAMARDRDGVFFSGAAGVRRFGHPEPVTADTVFALFSCTKALTVTAALKLVEDGRLDLDLPAKTYLPDIADIGVFAGYARDGSPRVRAPKREITARMLMLHTAGFGYDFANPVIKRLVDEGRVTPHRTATKAGFRQPLVNDPGERWEYGISIDWLGMVIERIVGERLDAILRAFVLDPLGIRETAHVPTPEMRTRLASMHQREADGALTPLDTAPRASLEVIPGGGGMFGTVGDYMRFLGMWLNDGAPVLRPETVAWAARDGLRGLN